VQPSSRGGRRLQSSQHLRRGNSPCGSHSGDCRRRAVLPGSVSATSRPPPPRCAPVRHHRSRGRIRKHRHIPRLTDEAGTARTMTRRRARRRRRPRLRVRRNWLPHRARPGRRRRGRPRARANPPPLSIPGRHPPPAWPWAVLRRRPRVRLPVPCGDAGAPLYAVSAGTPRRSPRNLCAAAARAARLETAGWALLPGRPRQRRCLRGRRRPATFWLREPGPPPGQAPNVLDESGRAGRGNRVPCRAHPSQMHHSLETGPAQRCARPVSAVTTWPSPIGRPRGYRGGGCGGGVRRDRRAQLLTGALAASLVRPVLFVLWLADPRNRSLYSRQQRLQAALKSDG
jgi:hypothetical protein